MAGTYATDLQPVGTTSVADTGTYPTNIIEFTGYIAGSIVSTTTPDTDNFIQGIAGITGLSSKSANTGNSLAYGRGSTLVINGGACLNIWAMYALPSALDTFAATNGAGVQVAVGTAAGSFSTYRVDGQDTAPYGGWKNYIVDLRNTNTGPNSGGSTGVTNPTNSYYGATFRQIASFKTAVPLAIDAIRYGRHTLSATGGDNTSVNNVTPLDSTAANFPQMSNYNDWNSGGTPTFGDPVDNGYHRFGQLQEADGSYLARGILSLGTTSTSVYFDDANRNINFQDMFVTYNDFNRIEIRHAASIVKLNSCNFSFIPRDSTLIASQFAPATPRGNFEVVDNATVTITSCSFTDMNTFIFLSNSTITSATFRRCDLITPNGATITSSLITNSTSTTSYITSTPANFNSKITNVTFNKDTGFTTPNAVDIGTISTNTTLNWNSIKLTGTDSSAWVGTAGTNIASTTNGAVKVTFGANVTLTISVSGDANIPTVEKVGTGTVNIESNVNNTITVVDTATNPISGAQVAVYTVTGDTELYNNQTNGSGISTFSSSTSVSFYVRVRKSTTGTTRYIPVETTGSSGTTGANITITLTEDILAEL